MRTSTFILIIVLIILILLIIYTIYTYKTLKKLTLNLNSTWTKIETELKNKFDLIPEFLKLIKTYKIDENNALKGIIESRNKWNVASTWTQKIDANNTLTESLINIFKLIKEHPNNNDIKLTNLTKELENIEDRISTSSNLYNEISLVLEAKIKRFPSSLIAKLFKFTSPEIFKVSNPMVFM